MEYQDSGNAVYRGRTDGYTVFCSLQLDWEHIIAFKCYYGFQWIHQITKKKLQFPSVRGHFSGCQWDPAQEEHVIFYIQKEELVISHVRKKEQVYSMYKHVIQSDHCCL